MYITVAIILGVKNVRESRRGNHEWISRDTSNIGHKQKSITQHRKLNKYEFHRPHQKWGLNPGTRG